MRITDNILQRNYLSNLNRNKKDVSKIQEQITTEKKINRPSDSPLIASRIIRYNEQLGDITSYISNANFANAFANKTMITLEGIQDSLVDMQADLTSMDNSLEVSSYSSYAQKFEDYINNLVDYANADYDGKYLFAGTDVSTKPFTVGASSSSVTANSSDMSGSYKVKISNSSNQKINIPGDEAFSSIMKTAGNLDSSAAVGAATNISSKVYDDAGNEYSVALTYTKTAANSYSLQYNITDASSNSVTSGTHTLAFDSTTGELSTIDGSSPTKINISVNSPKIKMSIDTTNLVEKSGSTSITQSQNIKGDIFNTLVSIKDGLKNGIAPNTNQKQMIKDFYSLVLDKASEIGNISNRITNVSAQLTDEQVEVTSLLSDASETDVAKAAIELQNKKAVLEYSYKVSSMILPKSLMDYI